MQMPFGKHKGVELDQVPRDYLRWVWSNCDVESPGLRTYLEKLFGPMPNQPEQERPQRPSGQSARGNDALPESVIRIWSAKMTQKYHPDRGGSHEQMLVVNEGKELLKSLFGQEK